MGEQQLAGPEAYAMVGTVSDRAVGLVVKREFQRWAAAVNDRNPVYFDADFARACGYADVIAPPLYVQYVTLPVVDLDELRPDGTPGGPSSGEVPLPRCPRRMAGGAQLSFYEPLYDGMSVSAVRTITGVEEKRGRTGPFVLVSTETVYTDQDDTVVAVVRDSMIARP